MSSNLGQAVEEVCASCGITGGDDVKLKICTAFKLVKYCSVDCQKNHRSQHKKACKKKAAEIRDVQLFTQPGVSYLGECPICCLPLPLDITKSMISSCCSKRICNGCAHADDLRFEEEGLEERCPYCREPLPDTEEEADQNEMKRAKANDPIALLQIGIKCCNEGDFDGAFEYYTKAAALGNMDAHFNLSVMYEKGNFVETDLKKKIYHLEEAAIGGHPSARVSLAYHEGRAGRYDRAVKHYIIAANLGYHSALEAVEENFRREYVSEEDYEAALCGYQAAVGATKSTQREEAEKAKREGSYRTLP